MGVKLEGIVG